MRDFAHELVAEHFGLDSKVARTLIALVRDPGRLTNEFIQGRRVRYVPPLRLYLSLSVLFFLVSALTSNDHEATTRGARTEVGGVVRPDTAAIGPADTPHRDSVLKARQSRVRTAAVEVRHNQRAFLDDTLHSNFLMRAFKRRTKQRINDFAQNQKQASIQTLESFEHHLPDAVFLLVPMLALMLSVVYFRQHRYYAEHLVFALHMQAFAFAALIASKLPIPLLGVFLFFGGVVYAYVALRTVYGEGKGWTLVKLGVLGAGYGLSLVVIMALLGLFVFLVG